MSSPPKTTLKSKNVEALSAPRLAELLIEISTGNADQRRLRLELARTGAPHEGGPDLFVHVSAVERSRLKGPNGGDRVGYEVEEDRRSGTLAAAALRVTGSGSPSSSASRPDQRSQSNFRPHEAGNRPACSAHGSDSRRVEGRGRGVVKWLNATKGFGFIQPEAGGEDVFVHISAVEPAGLRDRREGERVSFDIERDGCSGKTAAVNLPVEG